jgi:hypothetical protein
MNSLQCISDAKINCCVDGKCSDDMCPDTHHCCAQKSDKPILGLCVKRDKEGGTNNCDRSRGLPISNCRDSTKKTNKNISKENYERVMVTSKEGFNDEDNSDNSKSLAVKLLIIVLSLIAIYIFISRN